MIARVPTAMFAAILIATAACGTDGSVAAPDPTVPAAKTQSDVLADNSGQEQTLEVGRDVGERVLDFSISLEDGTVRTSEELLSAGRPVFIYFMATWCPRLPQGPF